MLRTRAILVAGLIVVVFLVSFLPQFIRATRLDGELHRMQQESSMSELRDLSALTYFQATQKNYGLAASTSGRFFNRVHEIASQAPDSKKKDLDDLISFRDRITAGLAKGDPGVLNDLQTLFMKTRRATGLSD